MRSTRLRSRFGRSSLHLPAGARLTLTIQGKDFERPGETGATKGVGWMYHTDPGDRPPAIFHGTHAVPEYTGSGRDTCLPAAGAAWRTSRSQPSLPEYAIVT